MNCVPLPPKLKKQLFDMTTWYFTNSFVLWFYNIIFCMLVENFNFCEFLLIKVLQKYYSWKKTKVSPRFPIFNDILFHKILTNTTHEFYHCFQLGQLSSTLKLVQTIITRKNIICPGDDCYHYVGRSKKSKVLWRRTLFCCILYFQQGMAGAA